jgi:hypothetical protein
VRRHVVCQACQSGIAADKPQLKLSKLGLAQPKLKLNANNNIPYFEYFTAYYYGYKGIVSGATLSSSLSRFSYKAGLTPLKIAPQPSYKRRHYRYRCGSNLDVP